MTLSRRLALVARVSVASAWAGCLVVLGLWLMLEGSRWLAIPRGVGLFGAMFAVAGGLFVFMEIVADRLIPGVGRRKSMMPLEFAMLALAAIGFVGAVLSYRGG